MKPPEKEDKTVRKIKRKVLYIIGERWGFWKKFISVCIILVLVFGYSIPVFLYVKHYRPSVVKENKVTEITDILLEINKKLDPDIAYVIAQKIENACNDYQMDVGLIIAIIEVESGAKIGAINPISGAMGLMQVLRTDGQLEKMGIPRSERHRLLHIEENIFEGVRTLAEGFQKDGTVMTALFKYNGVLKNKYDGIKYVADVLSKYYDRECKDK